MSLLPNKAKIFSGNPQLVEQNLNKWFEEHTECRIVSVSQSPIDTCVSYMTTAGKRITTDVCITVIYY